MNSRRRQHEEMKTKCYKKSVSVKVVALIQKAIHYTAEKCGETVYIFVDDRDENQPLKYDTIQGRVMRMIRKKDLWDDNERSFGFGTHMFRHSYGTKLTEMHLDDWTIVRFWGHNNLRNVKYYRKMGSQLLADETRQARHQFSVNILGCLDRKKNISILKKV